LLWRKIFRPQDFIQREQKAGLAVYRIEGFYFVPPSEYSNVFGWKKAVNTAFRQYVKDNGRPDLIHAHNVLYAGMAANKLSSESGIPYLITEHSSFVARQAFDKRLLPAIKKAYQEAASILTVSDSLGKDIERLLPVLAGRWQVLANVLDPEVEEAPWSMPLQNRHRPFCFLTIGSLIPIKGHENLVRAWQSAFGNNPDVHLSIAGTGELETDLKKLVDSLGLQNMVSFPGKLSRQQVIQELDNCNCFVFSSRYETFGVVLIEAMSRGKPVVSTACGGPNTLVDERSGILCETDHIESMAAALLNMWQNARHFNPQKIREEAIARFGAGAFLHSIEAIYQKII
jgi:glycosyltransferase involved in cell wall biosynthesis